MVDATQESANVIRLRDADNVAIATRHLQAGTRWELAGAGSGKLRNLVMFGHKFAIAPIPEGGAVRKYGQIIGFATRSIEPGEHVHTHNVRCDRYERDYAHATAIPPAPASAPTRYFEGYLRDDGRVGTRNYLAVISSVNCSAAVCHRIAERFRRDGLSDFPNVDGVLAFTHDTGCGMAASGLDREHLHRTLAGIARHPNIVDYVIVGLGCEVNQPGELIEVEHLIGKKRRQPLVLSIQTVGGVQKTIDAGVSAIREMLPRANECRRTKQPASQLVLGTNCGGSDGNSGITANPALGFASDLLVAQGGTSILGETPEIYGAEHLLTRRAVRKEVGEKLVERIRWWEWYTGLWGAEINNNPSHGNKEGGLTTIYEKSLGAVAKAGSTALVDVYQYAEPVTAKGMVVMDTPGFDPASVTGIVAGGANVVAFTTGRGSVFGCKPAPSLKIATNTPLYEHMTDDMDIDAGVVLSGTPVEEVGRRIFDALLDVASGRPTKSEAQGIGDDEFVPWLVGPML